MAYRVCQRWQWIAVVGLCLVSCSAWVALWQQRAWAAPADREEVSGDLAVVTLHTPTGDNLVVVDRQRKVIAVYRVDEGGTTIQLRSVRDIRWDLMLEELNPSNPSPAEVRAMLPQR